MTRPAGTKNATRGERIPLHTTVPRETMVVIVGDRRPGEPIGAVIERWAADRAVEALKGEKK